MPPRDTTATEPKEPSKSPKKRRAKPASQREQWYRRLLTQAENDPPSVLRDPRCHRPEFCRDFFDLCDGMALEHPSKAAEYVDYAFKLAEKIDDEHLTYGAFGVAVHALIAIQKRVEAAQLLEMYRERALECCEPCKADWYRRQADLLVENRKPKDAGAAIDSSLATLGDGVQGDALARICFIRSIQHHYSGEIDKALDDAETVLMELSLDSPRGYLLDMLALIACFLQGRAETPHIERALAILNRFRSRLKGRPGFGSVLTRYRWLEGQLLARTGEYRKAIDRLESVRNTLIRDAPEKHTAAVTLDQSIVLSRRVHDVSRRRILTLLSSCKRRMKTDRELKKRFHRAIQRISADNEQARDALVSTRDSFIVPVPGIVEEPGSMRIRQLARVVQMSRETET